MHGTSLIAYYWDRLYICSISQGVSRMYRANDGASREVSSFQELKCTRSYVHVIGAYYKQS